MRSVAYVFWRKVQQAEITCTLKCRRQRQHVNSAHTGTFGPLNLRAVHIDGMDSQTLVSLSQFCAGGTTGTKYIGVFTPTEYRTYEMQSALSVLSALAKTGKEAERGRVQNGIYASESSWLNQEVSLMVTSYTPSSL